MSVELSKGLEHPEVYLDLLNILLMHHGYANITIPNSVVPGLAKIRHPSQKIRQLFFRILDSQPPKTSKKHFNPFGTQVVA